MNMQAGLFGAFLAFVGIFGWAIASVRSDIQDLNTSIAEVAAQAMSDWIVDTNDNICGVNEAHQITKPCVVDYDKCIKMTKAYATLKKEKVTEDSARGIILMAKAAEEVRVACNTFISNSPETCSIWKKIKSKSGKKVLDITGRIKDILSRTPVNL